MVSGTRLAVYLSFMISTPLALVACGGGGGSSPAAVVTPAFSSKAELGEALFSDKNLSFNRSQSCATCHDPERAFIDSRLNPLDDITEVSLGDDDFSQGDRNTPTAAYAQLIPEFKQETHARFNSQQTDYQGFVGGQFVDGRATDLKAQALAPPTNPIEMGMPDRASVVVRLLENSDYEISFKAIYGNAIFDNDDSAYEAMAESIAEFEKTDVFAPFDSKYDRSLTGDFTYSPLSKAALGKALFFSQQFTNCATCHQLKSNSSPQEPFTSYEYHNIGIPENVTIRALNGSPSGFVDEGLLSNPSVNNASERGKFKVPTLRNIAVTEPYMHNGLFRDLKTVIHFYDHFLSNSQFAVNPETGSAWRTPEVTANISLNELQDGSRLSDTDVEGLVCFLRTLTDAKYEALIEDKGIVCND